MRQFWMKYIAASRYLVSKMYNGSIFFQWSNFLFCPYGDGNSSFTPWFHPPFLIITSPTKLTCNKPYTRFSIVWLLDRLFVIKFSPFWHAKYTACRNTWFIVCIKELPTGKNTVKLATKLSFSCFSFHGMCLKMFP